jgi:GNAT superfamily N-acetyltransferase
VAGVQIEIRARPLEAPADNEISELAGLFDQYRAHYGEAHRAGQSAQWLKDNLGTGRLTAFIADIRGELVGFAITMHVPASLRLSHYWQIRDLFVAPNRRHLGVARELLAEIRRSAAASGALRLAVQTEAENTVALRLYEGSGFIPVEGYRGLVFPLVPDDGR